MNKLGGTLWRHACFTLAVALLPVPVLASPPSPSFYCSAASPGPAISLQVSGIKAPKGKLRIWVYGDNPADFLKKKRRLKRVNVQVRSTSPARICIEVPKRGRYALIVQHDINGNKRADWSDGGGASRNPEVTLLRLKPRFDEVSFEVNGVAEISVVLKYRQDLKLTAAPITPPEHPVGPRSARPLSQS